MSGALATRIETAEDAKMGLLKPTINYFVIKEKWWDWGGGDIYNEDLRGAIHLQSHKIGICGS